MRKTRSSRRGSRRAAADDSGLTVDALGGEPGIWSARYAARCGVDSDHDDEANNRLVLRKLESVSDEARGAAFVCAIACVLPDGSEFTVRGAVADHKGGRGRKTPFRREGCSLRREMRLFAAELKRRLAEVGTGK